MTKCMRRSHGLTYQTEDNPAFYSKTNTEVDSASYADITEWMRRVIGKIPLKQSECFTLCDYGCADGGGSSLLVKEMIELVREIHGAKSEVLVIFEDQPENNFAAIFEKKEERLPICSGVYYLACGTSFYKQCLPDDFLNLGICVHGIDWMSHKPCELSNALIVHDGGTEEELAQYAKVAAEDWSSFLLHRAAELRRGGYLRIINEVLDAGGRLSQSPMPASNPKKGRPISPLLNTIRNSMLRKNLITQDEAKRMCWPYYQRDEKDISEPFQTCDSLVYQRGLRLISMERRSYDCGLRAKYFKGTEQTVSEELEMEFVPALVASYKAFLYTVIVNALSKGRSSMERTKLADFYFRELEKNILKKPMEYGQGLCTIHITVQKI